MISAIKDHKPRIILGLLLILHIALISLQAKNLEGTSLLKIWLINANAPVIHIIERSSQRLERVWRQYFYLKGLYKENQTLKREVADLQLQVWKNSQILDENRRLTELVQFKRQLPYSAEGARVVIKKPSFFSQTIFIDKGSAYGLKRDIPVISIEGVVGRIWSVSQTLAEVRLITNSGEAANAIIESRGVRGVINGTGGEWLTLMYVGQEAKVEAGDVVTTFGMDGTYPKGLRIGTIVDVRPSTTIYKDIKVKPATDVWRLEDVLLLIKP
ncbi:MAG: rod shape-determining protein MreC [Acidobacteria bacterium]|nr:rod shape-determining protein MreC [Acidobacteriota bacterium]MBI3655799.1 rod shape-determining protein MreC [Acidobacteriota bacterium]